MTENLNIFYYSDPDPNIDIYCQGMMKDRIQILIGSLKVKQVSKGIFFFSPEHFVKSVTKTAFPTLNKYCKGALEQGI